MQIEQHTIGSSLLRYPPPSFGIGPRVRKRFPFVTVGNISSITQKHGRIKSSRFMASLLIRLANQLKIVDFMSLFLCKNYLHIGLIRNLRAFLNLGNPERKTCLTLRQRLARFVRKTLSFSTSLLMHDACLKLFLHRYNIERAATHM